MREYGVAARVTAVLDQHREAATYNLEVADYHTYFVGRDRVWVHNACFSAAETAGLKQLFGQGVKGARAALAALEDGSMELPNGVTPATHQSYKDAVTAAGDATANSPVNVMRLNIVDTLLGLK